ncbi:S41 family peptidase [Variovorax sp.]|uniref:S41 family peptidase n=1 Tax=Variovorax sp. TaxID=1871043 RepID=UPI003BACFD65
MRRLLPSTLLALALGAPAVSAAAQSPDTVPLAPAERDRIVARAAELVQRHYVLPAPADAIAARLRARLRDGAYAGIDDADALRAQLEQDLQSVNQDKHLLVAFSREPLPKPADAQAAAAAQAHLARQYVRFNHCFYKAERMAGNVGYIDLRCFDQPEALAATAAATFEFLAHTDALIVDLRQNGGGWPAGVAQVSSHLLEGKVHLNDVLHREGHRVESHWTRAKLRGPRYLDRPVYVLTSSQTFSGGEEFAYNLQALKRARIVGERTKGGAHPSSNHRLNDRFEITIPFARAINPITRTNWEGTGVVPDLPANADEALGVAHLAALRGLVGKDSDPTTAYEVSEAIKAAETSTAGARK